MFQELFPSSKYKMKTENDLYQLIISNPKVEDMGKYTVEIAGIACTAFLNVDGTKTIWNKQYEKMNVTLSHWTAQAGNRSGKDKPLQGLAKIILLDCSRTTPILQFHQAAEKRDGRLHKTRSHDGVHGQ